MANTYYIPVDYEPDFVDQPPPNIIRYDAVEYDPFQLVRHDRDMQVPAPGQDFTQYRRDMVGAEKLHPNAASIDLDVIRREGSDIDRMVYPKNLPAVFMPRAQKNYTESPYSPQNFFEWFTGRDISGADRVIPLNGLGGVSPHHIEAIQTNPGVPEFSELELNQYWNSISKLLGLTGR